jgi:hypothetical protein
VTHQLSERLPKKQERHIEKGYTDKLKKRTRRPVVRKNFHLTTFTRKEKLRERCWTVKATYVDLKQK